MLQMMCEHPDWESADLSSLRYVIYGGSPITEEVAQAWLDRGVVVQQGYGMTEASPGVFMALPDGAPSRPVSAGVPHFFTDVRLDVEGEPVAGPGSGELLVRGPHVFAGYWSRPEETAQVLDDGWYRSGDVVRIEDDGWAYVVDRVKDMIISGGENIYPAEVEAAIAELADVTSAAVVAVPDPTLGRGRLRLRRAPVRRRPRRDRPARPPRAAAGPLQDPALRRAVRRPAAQRHREGPALRPARAGPPGPPRRPTDQTPRPPHHHHDPRRPHDHDRPSQGPADDDRRGPRHAAPGST